jgi:hypothetical protein
LAGEEHLEAGSVFPKQLGVLSRAVRAARGKKRGRVGRVIG